MPRELSGGLEGKKLIYNKIITLAKFRGGGGEPLAPPPRSASDHVYCFYFQGSQHLPIISEDTDDVTPETSEQPSRRISKIDDSDLSEVKATTARLNLKTRRASVIAWKAQYVDKPSLAFISVESSNTEDDRLTPERKNRINQALDWIKNELVGETLFSFRKQNAWKREMRYSQGRLYQ